MKSLVVETTPFELRKQYQRAKFEFNFFDRTPFYHQTVIADLRNVIADPDGSGTIYIYPNEPFLLFVGKPGRY